MVRQEGMVREQHTSLCEDIYESKEEEVTALESQAADAGATAEMLTRLRELDIQRMASETLATRKECHRQQMDRLREQNQQLKDEIVRLLLPQQSETEGLKDVQEYSELLPLIDEQNTHLREVHVRLQPGSRNQALLTLTEDCCQRLYTLATQCQGAWLPGVGSVAPGQAATGAVLQGRIERMTVLSTRLQEGTLQALVQKGVPTPIVTTQSLEDLGKDYGKERDLMVHQRQVLKDLRWVHSFPNQPKVDIVKRLLGNSIHQMALSWGEGMKLKTAVQGPAGRNPTTHLSLKPILQQQQYQSRAVLLKHIQQLKALLVLLPPESDAIETETEELRFVHGKDEKLLKGVHAKIAALLAQTADNPEADDEWIATQLQTLFDAEETVLLMWVERLEALCLEETPVDPGQTVTEVQVYGQWLEHEKEVAEIQFESQLLMRDILQTATENTDATAPPEPTPAVPSGERPGCRQEAQALDDQGAPAVLRPADFAGPGVEGGEGVPVEVPAGISASAAEAMEEEVPALEATEKAVGPEPSMGLAVPP